MGEETKVKVTEIVVYSPLAPTKEEEGIAYTCGLVQGCLKGAAPDKTRLLHSLVRPIHRHRVVGPGSFEIPPELRRAIVTVGAGIHKDNPAFHGKRYRQGIGVAVVIKGG